MNKEENNTTNNNLYNIPITNTVKFDHDIKFYDDVDVSPAPAPVINHTVDEVKQCILNRIIEDMHHSKTTEVLDYAKAYNELCNAKHVSELNKLDSMQGGINLRNLSNSVPKN